eukprot:1734072-Prymnesium_polylepis.1
MLLYLNRETFVGETGEKLADERRAQCSGRGVAEQLLRKRGWVAFVQAAGGLAQAWKAHPRP